MKIVTWNINGIRATTQSLKNLLKSTDGDVICLQETKITKDQLESDVALIEGYNSYYSFCQTRAGYSGVATYCKDSASPVCAQSGLSRKFEGESGGKHIGCYGNLEDIFSRDRLDELDKEGRTIMTQHEVKDSISGTVKKLTIINVYCPRADPEKEERKFFKLDFYKALEERAKALIKSGSYVVIVGDINASHKPIDHCDPKDPILFYDNLSRVWLDSFVYNSGDYSTLPKTVDHNLLGSGGIFVDSFRYFYPKKRDMFTCWCTSNRARQTNYGTRIDYIFCDAFLANLLQSCEILTDFLGSDHCPVESVINVSCVSSKCCPPLCTAYMSEFGGRQQKLLSYFSKATSKQDTNANTQSLSKKRTLSEKKSDACLLQKKSKQRKITSQTTLAQFVKKSNQNNNNNKVKEQSKEEISVPLKRETFPAKPKANKDASAFWKKLLKGPDPPPLCKGHQEPCVLRTVKKEGPNLGRQFHCCSRPEGHRSNPDANCQFFKWIEKSKKA